MLRRKLEHEQSSWRRADTSWPKIGRTWDRNRTWLCGSFVLLSIIALCDGLDALIGGPTDLMRAAVALVAVAISTVIALLLGRRATRVLTVDIDGIETRDLAGRVTRILWTEPHELEWGGVASFGGRVLSQRAAVRTVDGRCIEVADSRTRSLASETSLSSIVRRLSTEAHYHAIRPRLAAGETVEFGPARLSATALTLASTTVPLNQIAEQLTVDRGYVELRPRSPRARAGLGRFRFVRRLVPARTPRARVRLPIRQIPHAPTLFRALEDLTEIRAEHTAAQRVVAVMQWSGGCSPAPSYS